MKILTSGKVNRKLDCRYCGTIVELSREEVKRFHLYYPSSVDCPHCNNDISFMVLQGGCVEQSLELRHY